MADELLRSKHGFGNLIDVENAKLLGKLDEYDILFLDGDTEPKIGWIDKNGLTRVVDTQKVIVAEDNLPEAGVEGKIYIYGEDGYFWNGERFINLCKPTDVTELTAAITALETLVETKADAEQVKANIEKAVEESKNYADEKDAEILELVKVSYEKVEYEISAKPVNTLVDYCEKEIRVMCPVDTEWELQQSGAGADANKYYIGLKAYAPNENVVSFKEDLAEIIADDTMYYFENNEFAGVDEDGRKYSIVWLPVAVYDEVNKAWTYYGVNSSASKYIGWYYSVEWYNADGLKVASDCIRVNLSNEECHSRIEPFYISNITENVIAEANTYTDEQITAIINTFTIVEF